MLRIFKIWGALQIFFFSGLLYAQLPKETTFRSNGPDDFRESIHAFVNATIYLNYNFKLDSATLVIQEGKIKAIGKNIPVPKEAILHYVAGKYIYPAFIDVFADYGIQGNKSAYSETENPDFSSNIKGAYGWNDAIKTYYHAASDFKVNDERAAEWRKMGFGAVLTHRRDGIARGTAAVVTLANDKENFVMLREKAAAVYSFNKGSSKQEYPSSLMGAIALLRQTHYDALWYARSKDRKEVNLSLEEWNAQQNLPQIFDAGHWQNCLRAQKIGDEFGKKFLLKADGTEYQRIDAIKKLQVPIITSVHFPKTYDVEDPFKALYVSIEDMKHWELAPTNLAALQNAGIEFAITPADLEKKGEFLNNLRKAVRYGLKPENALKALTYIPAKLLGIDHLCGSLEPGKLANFIIASHPLFDEKCVLHENWIQGKKYDIQPRIEYDIRGNYLLDIYTAKDTLQYSRLQLLGEPAQLKSQIFITDTQKIEVKVFRKEQELVLVFSSYKKTDDISFRLSGMIDYATFTISGKGQNSRGEWVSWQARRISLPPADTAQNKKDSVDWSKLGKVWFPQMAYGWEQLPAAQNYLIKKGTVWTNESEGILSSADVLLRNGKIVAVGKGLSCADCEIIDASNKHITCGIIDEHSHIAIAGGVNEGTEASSAEVRIGDVINCEHIDIYRHLAGGVTAAQLLHGSANPIGGQSALVKMRWGSLPEQMKIEGADGFIKFALGENVKQSNWGDRYRSRYPQSRMGVEQTYYNYFNKAKEYTYPAMLQKSQKKPSEIFSRRDLELEAIKEILEQKRFITCHSYVQSEINMLMHVADSFGFKVNTFTHILEGYKVADKLKQHGAHASTFSDWWAYKMEVVDAIPHNAYLLTRVGVNTAINSDDAEMARRLNQEAAKSIKYGKLTEEEAWKLVTLNPAKMLHLDKRMGSIKAGKDADIIVWSDNPLSIYANVEYTFVDGVLLYSSKLNELLSQRNERERARLIQKMLEEKKNGAPTQEPVKKEKEYYDCGQADQLKWLENMR